MSLPYEGIIDRGPCIFVTEFSTISTDHCNQTEGVCFALKCLLNTAINNKLVSFSEVVTIKKRVFVHQVVNLKKNGKISTLIPKT